MSGGRKEKREAEKGTMEEKGGGEIGMESYWATAADTTLVNA